MNQKLPKIQLAVAIIAAIAVLYLRFFVFSRNAATYTVVYFAYWALILSAGLYLYNIYKYVRGKSVKSFLGRHKLGLGVALCASVYLQVNEPRQFKFLFDEFSISGVAHNMHFSREASFPARAHNINDRLEILENGIDKRPLFFQFVLACIHDVTGYRPGNVFILNGIASFGLLFLSYYYGAVFGGWKLGMLNIGLWISLPLLAQTATSGGYDVFNLLMIFVLVHFCREYMRNGGDNIQNLLVLTAVHLGQVRYESILYVLPVAGLIVFRWVRDRSIRMTWVTAMAPAFLLIPILINLVYVSTPSSFESGAGQSFFGIEYLAENLSRAVYYLYQIDLTTTNNPWFSLVGTVCLVAFAVKTLTRRSQFLNVADNLVVVMIGAIIAATSVLTWLNFWGQWDDCAASRFSMPLHLLFVLCFTWVMKDVCRKSLFHAWVPAGVVILAVATGGASAAQHRATRTLWEGREYAWLFEQLKSHKGAFVISNPMGPIIHGYPSIDLRRAEAGKWKINECIKAKLYPEILVLERISVDMQSLAERPYSRDRSLDIKQTHVEERFDSALSAAFKKEVVAEMRLRANVVSRLSRIVSVDGPEAVPPKEYLDAGPPFKNAAEYYKHIYSALP